MCSTCFTSLQLSIRYISSIDCQRMIISTNSLQWNYFVLIISPGINGINGTPSDTGRKSSQSESKSASDGVTGNSKMHYYD